MTKSKTISLPNLTLEVTGSQQINLKDLKGQRCIIYFYPKDMTSGCTLEAQDFTESYQVFQQHDVKIFGVSRDSIKKHENFKAKYNMPFDLISDPEEKLCNHFEVMGEKSMYGKKYMGIIRSTFLIDEQGKVSHEWRNVKVKGHVDEVLATLAN